MKALSHERPISDHRPQTGRDFATITQAPQAPSMAGGGSRHVGAALNFLVIEIPRCCRKPWRHRSHRCGTGSQADLGQVLLGIR